MKLWNSVKDYFSYTVKEQRGIFVLTVLLLLLILVRTGLPRMTAGKSYDSSGFERQFQLLASMITDSLAEDTVKVLSPQYEKIRVTRPVNSQEHSRIAQAQGKRAAPQVVELNSADSLALVRLPGIGPVLARRIMKYRESLGGFHDLAQLKEIYGMDTIALKAIIPYLKVDEAAVLKMELNEATFKELLHHPYLEYEEVKLIVNYRDRHHPLDSLEQLYQINGLEPGLIRRIQPYLKLGPD
ncbi:MAG: helix-hairpin-helix domain-containing protein [Bacteroidales bacterium]|nr:helix-hairpin-helix domain-containing protein [Lentimicrobiaceae bacterium]MDD5694446.1 helix-hairpin-helix domain-containing protein [Bacteroidales bacterium]